MDGERERDGIRLLAMNVTGKYYTTKDLFVEAWPNAYPLYLRRYGIGTCRAIERDSNGDWVYGVSNIELGT